MPHANAARAAPCDDRGDPREVGQLGGKTNSTHNTTPNQNQQNTKLQRLTSALLRDRQAATPSEKTPECFACGRPYTYREPDGDDSSRFCSSRCREAYDAGFPRYERPDVDRWYSLPKGRHGFLIKIRAHCRNRFDSKGLRCCSPIASESFGTSRSLMPSWRMIRSALSSAPAWNVEADPELAQGSPGVQRHEILLAKVREAA